ncbi:hypothetical protein Bbelb_177460 [Branchiostoma belcheri]|nr:hypothetical protein Bbelb_177460 [Branchiostoma belcheri]
MCSVSAHSQERWLEAQEGGRQPPGVSPTPCKLTPYYRTVVPQHTHNPGPVSSHRRICPCNIIKPRDAGVSEGTKLRQFEGRDGGGEAARSRVIRKQRRAEILEKTGDRFTVLPRTAA